MTLPLLPEHNRCQASASIPLLSYLAACSLLHERGRTSKADGVPARRRQCSCRGGLVLLERTTTTTTTTTARQRHFLVCLHERSLVLGEGFFSRVLLGIDCSDGAPVAVKRIYSYCYQSAVAAISSISSEIALQRRVSSPRRDGEHQVIVPLLAVCGDVRLDRTVSLVMPYYNGGTLLDLLERSGPLTEHRARPVMRQILAALSIAHRCGIAHRDVKAENFLLNSAGNAILADWGLAAEFVPGKATLSGVIGSADYCSPEVLRGELYEGPEADAWSFGVLLYASLTGYFPTSTLTPTPMLLSVDATDLIACCLQREPQRRAKIDAALRHRWLAID